MGFELIKYTIHDKQSIWEALKAIDSNKKGFVFCIDDNNKLCATLTDGDIRRYVLGGGNLTETVDKAYNKKFTYLLNEDDINSSLEIFKEGKIRFIPIIDKEGRLVNILTKEAVYSLLLQGAYPDINYDFLSYEENKEYEIFNRPWGFYKTTILNDYFQSKIINVSPKASLSLQTHKKREEHWIIAHGHGEVVLAESVFEVYSGAHVFIPKGCSHRITNISDTEPLVMIEVQQGEYFGEDDIIRHDDMYGRS